jgi:hypothetical protein
MAIPGTLSPFVLRRINQLGNDFDNAEDTAEAIGIARAMVRLIEQLAKEEDEPQT